MAIRPRVARPRRLLARMRDVMAGSGAAEARLAEIVEILASDMVAEVCSVYVRRAGDMLELFATQGLNPEAVHRTRLRFGEGLVGDIAAHARPLSLADAQSHPNFVFRPETGEEIYSSLMGVPILRGGRVVGVVVVQNRVRRSYSEEEVETLQTVAMVLAELVGSGELINSAELLPADGTGQLPLRLEGISLNPGQAMGFAVLHQPQLGIRRLVAEDTEVEHRRLREAVADMHGRLDDMLDASDLAGGGEHRDVLESYRMIAEDAGWLSRIAEAIDGGLTAEAAVTRVHNDLRVRLTRVSDPYLRERVHDIEDLTSRLLGHLMGNDQTNVASTVSGDFVLIARNMGPAQLLDYDRTRLRGLVLEEGSPNSHVAIVARALDIPVVGHVRDALIRAESGDPVLVDGDSARVYVRPGEDIQMAFMEGLESRLQRRAVYSSLRDLPAVSCDGQKIGLKINAGLTSDVLALRESGADGIGLYRTELAFMMHGSFPNVAQQTRMYRDVLDQAGGRPVIFRTLDAGGDKTLPYWQDGNEENPAMGWRALRVALDRPALLRQQLRALLVAGAGRDMSIMFPMVAEVAEFERARNLALRELRRLRENGEAEPATLEMGVMLEVPGLLFQFPSLLQRVDFVSVGSNDLLQFFFASDRGNPRLTGRYDPLSPSVLSFMREVVSRCNAAGVRVSLCGEMAGQPLEAMALLGLGFRELSVTPGAVGPIKRMLRSLSIAPLTAYMTGLYDLPEHSVRGKLRAFALDHGVIV